jgi:signal transduction histidine kinase
MRRALARLPPPGLRLRLAGWVAALMLVSTGVTFLAVYRGTGTQLRDRVDRELSGDVADLARSLSSPGTPGPAGSRPRAAQALARSAARYIRAQPFKSSSTLLFAHVPGVGTTSNRPELFAGALPDSDETPAQQLREARLSAQLLRAPAGFSTLAVADLGNLRLLKRNLAPRGRLAVAVGAGEPLAPVAHAQRSVASAFLLAGLLALAGAVLAAYLIGTRMSRPLRRMAAVAARVDAGDLHPRIGDPGSRAGEVRVLAVAFDHMLGRLTEAFARERALLADASHELRTPLTVIRGQLELLAARPDPSPEEVRRVERQVGAEIARITRLVDDLLLLARSEQTEWLRVQPIDLAAFVGELWEGVTLLARRRFQLGSVPAGTLHADPDLLAQALRNLIANAIAHTAPERGLIRLAVERVRPEGVRFLIEDDGPGIPPAERERVFNRFRRLDAARDRASGGAGLGLAIVRAIALAHDGSVSAGESREGGARFELRLPAFEAGRARRPDASAQDAGVPDRVAAGLGPDA